MHFELSANREIADNLVSKIAPFFSTNSVRFPFLFDATKSKDDEQCLVALSDDFLPQGSFDLKKREFLIDILGKETSIRHPILVAVFVRSFDAEQLMLPINDGLFFFPEIIVEKAAEEMMVFCPDRSFFQKKVSKLMVEQIDGQRFMLISISDVRWSISRLNDDTAVYLEDYIGKQFTGRLPV